MGQQFAMENCSFSSRCGCIPAPDQQSNKSFFDKITRTTGPVATQGRFHRLPRKVTEAYEISKTVLGTGYAGDVLKGKHRRNGTYHAFKTIKLSKIKIERRQQLEGEIEVFLSVDHPHIVRLFDVYEGHGQMTLVMELLSGGELFNRIEEKKTLHESEASDAMRQMLLAVYYIHIHGIVHRDLKLENFLFDAPGSNYLKLIDFGFSKTVMSMDTRMKFSCGTLSYLAPEVMQKNYTSQCDLWSLGVILFILLSGYMPFSGSEKTMRLNILSGRFTVKNTIWDNVSKNGRDLTWKMLEVDPKKRINAEQALEHPFIANNNPEHHTVVNAELGIANALAEMGRASKFRRSCYSMLAWTLTNEERSKVREYFEEIDVNRHGTISASEFRDVMIKNLNLSDPEITILFDNLDTNHDLEIHYNDFLSAMVASQINLRDEAIRDAFDRFDIDHSGYITKENLTKFLGEDTDNLEQMLEEVDFNHDGHVSFGEFRAYIRGEKFEKPAKRSCTIS